MAISDEQATSSETSPSTTIDDDCCKSRSRAADRRRGRIPALTVSRKELLVNGSDEQFRGLIANLLAFSVRVRGGRAGFARFLGVSPIQYTILVSIAHLEEAHEVNVHGRWMM